jgi:hypothetical protein
MCKYDDVTLAPIPPNLGPGEKEHILVPQDESTISTNENPHQQWLLADQQPLKQKGNGHPIHICGWICETTGHLQLSKEQIKAQLELPEDQRLKVFDSWKIIYPGKNHNAWWDLKQLMEQIEHAVNIFEHTHPGKVAIWLFNCLSAHKGLALDALNVNNMNVNPGGKQHHL